MSLTPNVERFIARWKASGASQRANYQLFLTELCDLIGVEKPRPASDKVHEADYTFERPVVFDDCGPCRCRSARCRPKTLPAFQTGGQGAAGPAATADR